MFIQRQWFAGLVFTCCLCLPSLASDPLLRAPGMCVDGAKRPLNGVRVRVFHKPVELRPRQLDTAGWTLPNVNVTHETVTDSIGRFWLTDEQAVIPDAVASQEQSILVIESPGGLPQIRPLGHPVPHILDDAKTITSFRIIDADKQPVTDVVADCIGGDWPNAALQPSSRFALHLTADREGVIQVPVGASGTCLWVQAPGYLPRALLLQKASPQNPQERGFEVHQTKSEQTDLELLSSGEAIGRVVDEEGKPVPNMAIIGLVRPAFGLRRQIDLRGIETVSDDTGRFRLAGLPKDWIQLVAMDGARFGDAESLVTGIPWQAGDIVVRPMPQVSGKVWDSSRNEQLSSASSVRIAFRSRELGTRTSAQVNSRGEFSLSVPPFMEGELILLPHPSLVQMGYGVPVGKKAPAEIVVRVQQLATRIPDAELKMHLDAFPRNYALSDAAFARYVSPPFPQSRQALWQSLCQTMPSLPPWLKSMQLAESQKETQPVSMIFLRDNQGTFRCIHATPSEMFVATLLQRAFPQFSTSRIRFANEKWNEQPLDKLVLTGDFVLRDRLPLVEAVIQLEKILQDKCHVPIKLVVDYEQVETLHVRGRLNSQPLQGKKLQIKLAADVSDGPYGWSGTPTDLIASVARSLELDHLIDVDATGSDLLTWQTSWPPVVPSGDVNRNVNVKKRLEIMRQLAPSVLREQLGLDVDIHTVSLPRITVTLRQQ